MGARLIFADNFISNKRDGLLEIVVEITHVDKFQLMVSLLAEDDATQSGTASLNRASAALTAYVDLYTAHGISQRAKHDSYRQVLQPCVLHAKESWSPADAWRP